MISPSSSVIALGEVGQGLFQTVFKPLFQAAILASVGFGEGGFLFKNIGLKERLVFQKYLVSSDISLPNYVSAQ